jgi:ubiquinone biosynthesis protein COQ4
MNILHAAKGIKAFTAIVRDPNRLNEVFALREALGTEERLAAPVAALRRHPQAAAAFAEKRRLPVDLNELRRLPEGSLGHAFAKFLTENQLDPAAIPRLEAATDVDYFSAHLYETHDLWHLLTGFGVDVAGELGLQAFYATQFPGGLPMVILAAGFFNTLLHGRDDHEARIAEISRGFALGRDAKLLFGVAWDDHWARPLDEVRAEFGLAALASASKRPVAFASSRDLSS